MPEGLPQPLSKTIFKDIVAGMVVFLVALPLCLGVANASRASGIADGVNATILSGIIAGIVGGIVVGLLSNSHTSVSGPAAGLTAVVALQIAKVGTFQGFLVAVMLAGMIQLILGYFRTGSLAEFFPSSVIKGLLTAIGVILILKQLPHLVGHDTDPEGDMAFDQPDNKNTFTELLSVADDFNIGALIIGLSSLFILIFWDRFKTLKTFVVPSALVVVLWGILLNVIFRDMGGKMVLGSEHEVKLPEPQNAQDFFAQITTPDFSVLTSSAVYLAAFVLAIVASLETLLNIEAVEKLDPKQRRANNNRELGAQGVGNIISGALGGLPVTSVIVRSSANINAGSQTKLSTVVHGVFLLLCVALIPHYLNMIPLACLAAILLQVGYKLASPKIVRQMWKQGNSRFLPFIATVLAIVFTDLLIGIIIGLVVAVLFIIHSNLRRPVRVITEKHMSGEVVRIELANQVSFLNRASLVHVLEGIPRGGHVLLDASSTSYIDPDILDLINDFKEVTGPARKVEVSLFGFSETYNMQDRLMYVDYSTREVQDKLTPRDVFNIMKDGHERFITGEQLNRDLGRQVTGTAEGQFPIAAVLSCIDSRSPAEIIFDQSVGDIFSVRIAGNIAKEKVYGSLEYACAVAKSKLIIVLGHTRCGAVTTAVNLYFSHATAKELTGCEHIDALIGEIQKAIPKDAIAPADTEKTQFVDQVARENVRLTIEGIRSRSITIRNLEHEGNLAIIGAIYNVSSGHVDFFDMPEEWKSSAN